MGANSTLGLLLEIGADPSKAQEALGQFESATGLSMQRAAASALPLNDALLTNRESVRLLSEEMGVRLPRAVSGAMAEMLPSIGQLGGALLAVFAVEKVFDWSKAAADAIRALYTQADTSIKDLDAHFKTSLAGIFNIAELDARASTLERYHKAYKLLMDKAGGDLRMLGTISAEAVKIIAQASYEGLNSIADVDKAMNEVGKEQFAAHKRLAEVKGREDHALAEQVKRDATAARQQAKELQNLQNEAAMAVLANYREQKRVEHELFGEQQAALRLKTEAERRWDKLVRDDAKEEEKDLKELQKVMRQMPHDITFLGGALTQVLPKFDYWKSVNADALLGMQQFGDAARAEAAAVGKDLAGSLASLTEGLAGLIGGQKAAAVFKAGYEVAEGIACLASGTWPPNPPALIAAGLHFEAAAQYGMMGGGGGGGRHGGGGGGGFSSYGGGISNYGAGPGGGGGRAAGPGGHGPTIIFNAYGPVVGTWEQAATAMTKVLNQLTKSGQVKLIATSSLTSGPKQT